MRNDALPPPRRSRIATTPVGRAVRDGTVALATFLAVAAAVGWSATPARPMGATDVLAASGNSAQLVRADHFAQSTAAAVRTTLPMPQLEASGVMQQIGRSQGVIILGLAFTAIIAFNLAFLRHLRRVYASPRRGGRRRGSVSLEG